MPILIEASILRRIQRTRLSSTTGDGVALAVNTGLSANGNTLAAAANGRRVDLLLRNILNLTSPGALDKLRYGYTDDPDLETKGIPLEPGAAVCITNPGEIYVTSENAVAIPYIIDESTS